MELCAPSTIQGQRMGQYQACKEQDWYSKWWIILILILCIKRHGWNLLPESWTFLLFPEDASNYTIGASLPFFNSGVPLAIPPYPFHRLSAVLNLIPKRSKFWWGTGRNVPLLYIFFKKRQRGHGRDTALQPGPQLPSESQSTHPP